MTVSMLGVDLGKNSVSVVGLNDRGAVVLRRRVTRDSLMTLLTKLLLSKVAMKAWGGAHHIGRAAQALRNEVRLPHSACLPRAILAMIRVVNGNQAASSRQTSSHEVHLPSSS